MTERDMDLKELLQYLNAHLPGQAELTLEQRQLIKHSEEIKDDDALEESRKLWKRKLSTSEPDELARRHSVDETDLHSHLSRTKTIQYATRAQSNLHSEHAHGKGDVTKKEKSGQRNKALRADAWELKLKRPGLGIEKIAEELSKRSPNAVRSTRDGSKIRLTQRSVRDLIGNLSQNDARITSSD